MISLRKALAISFGVWILEPTFPPPVVCCEVADYDLAKYAIIAIVFAEVETQHGHDAAARVHFQQAKNFRDELKEHLIFNKDLQE